MDQSAYYGTEGWKEFLENKRILIESVRSAKRQMASQPISTEHGLVAENEFRKFLSSFLPERYGVCKGYILPPSPTKDDYNLYEYDIIIYDKSNAPCLFREADSSKSKTSQRIAIPSIFVYGVLEIKYSFTQALASEAIGKLNKLSKLRPFLRHNFFSSIVFFELHEEDILNHRILDTLNITEKIPGFVGSLILTAETVDIDLTGRVVLRTVKDEPLFRNLVLAKNIENVAWVKVKKFDDKGRVDGIMTHMKFSTDGTTPYMVNGPDGVNVYYSYSCESRAIRIGELYQLVHVEWSFNEFSFYLFELLRRMEGTYDGKVPAYHAISFLKESKELVEGVKEQFPEYDEEH
jgi:hypothetical protein